MSNNQKRREGGRGKRTRGEDKTRGEGGTRNIRRDHQLSRNLSGIEMTGRECDWTDGLILEFQGTRESCVNSSSIANRTREARGGKERSRFS